MRKWVYAVLILAVSLSITAAFLIWDQHKRFQSHLDEIEILRSTARDSSARAQSLAASGDYDLKIIIHRRLLDQAIQTLRGFERISSKGNRLVFQEAQAALADGEVQITARADFHARRGLYQGPVQAAYVGFVHVLENGACRLEFRAISAEPLEKPWLPSWLIEPWLVLKLQHKMRLPQFDLPLGVQREIVIPSIEKTVSEKQITVKVPGRKILLSAQNPNVLVTPDMLAVFVANIGLDDQVSAPRLPATPRQNNAEEDVRIELRLALLEEILSKAIDRDQDVFIEAAFIEDVWRQKKKVLGLSVTNKANLSEVQGYLDIRETRISQNNGQWALALNVGGHMTGVVSGKAYGIKISAPFSLTPSFNDQIPFRILTEGENLTIAFEDKPLTLALHIETEIVGRRLRFNYPLETNASDILQPIHLSRWLATTMKIPVYMEGKKIVRSKKLTAEINWQATLPETQPGFLILSGALTELRPTSNEETNDK